MSTMLGLHRYRNVGVTGNRIGITTAQAAAFRDFIQRHKPTQLTHGCCVGADEEMVSLTKVYSPETIIIARPGKFASGKPNDYHSWLAERMSTHVMEPDTMFRRNRSICTINEVLCVMPRKDVVSLPELAAVDAQGGTAYTFQHMTRKLRKRAVVFFADGEVEVVE